ncbi:MAG TPA: hypothetical protein VND99_02490 [Candidatus Acidoferrales bacterium]|nr:hypothetical protein [Candidatus Acidoferrales bacterium]
MAEKKNSELPSIQSLFQDSWELFKQTWTTYLKLVGFGIAFLFLGALIGLLISLPVSFIAVGAHFQVFRHLTPFHIATLVLLGFWVVFYLLSIIAMGVLFPIAGIFILQRKKASLIELLKQAKQFFWPYFLTMLLAGFLAFGGMILLVIPGIVIGIFFVFTSYEVVLEKQSGISALARSYFMVKNDFWQILGRVLLLEVCIWIVTSVLGHIIGRGLLLGLVQLVFSILLSWYLRAYIFLLYNQVRERTTFPQHISLRWVWIVSAIGWGIVILLFVSFGFGFMHLPWGQQNHIHGNLNGAA